MPWLVGKKTYIIAGLMAAKAFIGYLSGDMTLVEFIASPESQTVLEASGLASLRAGVTKSKLTVSH